MWVCNKILLSTSIKLLECRMVLKSHDLFTLEIQAYICNKMLFSGEHDEL